MSPKIVPCLGFFLAVLALANAANAVPNVVIIHPSSCTDSEGNCQLSNVQSQDGITESQVGHNNAVRYIETVNSNSSAMTSPDTINNVTVYIDRFESGTTGGSIITIQATRPSDSIALSCTLSEKTSNDSTYDGCDVTTLIIGSSSPEADAEGLTVSYRTQALGNTKKFYLDHAYANVSYTDSSAPIVILNSPENNTWSNLSSTLFQFMPNDVSSDILNCTLVINEVLNATNSTISENQINYINSSLNGGLNRWTINCTDGSANYNIGTNVSKRVRYVDLTKPVLELGLPAANATILQNNMTLNLTVRDNLSPTSNCSVYLDNALNQTNSSVSNGTLTNFAINGVPQGVHNWSVSCIDLAGNWNYSETRNFTVNVTPIVSSVSKSSDPIKGGDIMTITASGVGDPNSDTLYFYCSESSSAPAASNTNCTGGTTIDTSPPYSLTCTYAVPRDDSSHTTYCRVFDGSHYSSAVNTSYTADSTPPVTSIVSVAGDSLATYYDNANNGQTEINISGESGMSCRYGTSDAPYSSMSNDCTISGTGGNCIATTTLEGLDAYNFYVSCQDSLGNSQNTTQNLDIIALVTDWTAPTTSDNSSTAIATPPYAVKITESDNLFSAATIATAYCTDTAGSCTPNIAADDNDIITFTSSNRGANYLRYNSSDPAGNMQSMQNKTININRLPVFASASDNAATIKGGSAVVINTVSSDPDSAQSLSLYVCNSTSANSSGCGHTTYCSNTTESANATCSFTAETDDATHAWYAFIYDSLNESSAANMSGSYVTDSAPPSIVIIEPDNITYAQTSISAAVSTSEPASWAGYSLNGAANMTMSNSTTTYWSSAITASNGGYALVFYANDSYGNMNTAGVSFSVDTALTDTVPPPITVWSPTNGTYYMTTSILANITLGEDGIIAIYSVNGTANATMGNTSIRVWNATLGLGDGIYNITFYANDTSPNRNSGKSGTTYFFVDTAKPVSTQTGNAPASANDTDDVTCHSRWTDNIGLDYAYLEHNETGTLVNSSMISLSGTSGWVNYTIAASNTTPGIVMCKAYVLDKAGLSNATNWTVLIGDNTKPLLENITYAPNNTDALDPGVMINVFVNASDNIALGKIILQFKMTNETAWNESVMFLDGVFYKGNFTPTVANYSFRVFANDTSSNQNTTSMTNVSVMQDYTWINSTTFPTTKSIVQTQPREIMLGNVSVNNTGDFDLNFTVTSDRSWILFNRTAQSLSFIVNSTNNITQFNVSANATGFAVGSYDYSIAINSYTLNPRLVSSQTINGTIVVQNVAGPYLVVTINAYDASVTQGDTNVLFSASVENAGTADATAAWLAWSIPSDWSNASGVLNRSIGFLGIGSSASNTINVSVSSSASAGSVTVSALAGSYELITGSDSKSVTVSSASGPGGSQSPSSSSGIGGTVAAGTTAEEKALLLQTQETLELVRGLNDTFTIKVTNPFKGSSMKNVTLSVKGFLSQYISITPEKIASIDYNSTGLFKVAVTAPSYLTKGKHPLNFTISGRLIQGAVTRDIIEKRLVTLEVHEVGKSEAGAAVEKARADYEEMLKANFSASNARKLLDDAEAAMASRDYETAKRLSEEITSTVEKAFSAHELLQRIRLDVSNSELDGLRVDETKNLLNMALAAFEREDYQTAERRAKDAQLAYALETVGKVNYFKLLIDNWEIAIISCMAAGIIAVVLHRRLTVIMIGRKLEDFAREEESISRLMREAQTKTYAKKIMSSSEYRDVMYKHEKRLEQIRELRTGLRAGRIGIITASSELYNLTKEDKDVTEDIKNAQKDYFEKRSISKTTYTSRMESLKNRKAEIDESLAVLEVKIEKKRRLSKLESGFMKDVFSAAKEIKLRVLKRMKTLKMPKPRIERLSELFKTAFSLDKGGTLKESGIHTAGKKERTVAETLTEISVYRHGLAGWAGGKLSEAGEWLETKRSGFRRRMILNEVYGPKPREYSWSLDAKRDIGLMIRRIIGRIKLKVG